MRILIISNNFPPCNVSASIRALNYANYLSELGHEITVIAADFPKDFINYDGNLKDKILPSIDVNYIDMGNLYKSNYTKKSANKEIFVGQKKNKFHFWVKNTLKNLIMVPDVYGGWRKNATKVGKGLVEKKKIDLIISMHESPSAHMVGYGIYKKFPNIRWIGYWSDPWTGDTQRSSNGKLRNFIEYQIEKQIIKNVDSLLFTSSDTIERYNSKFNLENKKCSIVYRGYSETRYEPYIMTEGIVENKINVVYTGDIFTKIRDLNPFCEALENIGEDIREKFNFIFVGNIDSVEVANRLNKFENVKLIPRVSFDVAQQYCYRADLLLLLTNKGSDQIPGKVYEYFGIEKPTVSLFDQENNFYNFMLSANKGPVIFNTKENIIHLLNHIEKMSSINPQWYNRLEKFSWEKVVQDLEAKIK